MVSSLSAAAAAMISEDTRRCFFFLNPGIRSRSAGSFLKGFLFPFFKEHKHTIDVRDSLDNRYKLKHLGNGRCRQAAAGFQLCTSLPTHHATLLEDEPLNLSLLRHCSLPHSTYFPFTTTTNFPFELLNSTYLLTKYLYVYLFSSRTKKNRTISF